MKKIIPLNNSIIKNLQTKTKKNEKKINMNHINKNIHIIKNCF